ncbi:MAG: VWA domain-containing protein [Rhodothermaceae bacterium]|nr:VWA domain-containing protein [Rhodothermaceae bacterium]
MPSVLRPRYLLVLLALVVGLAACADRKTTRDTEEAEVDAIEEVAQDRDANEAPSAPPPPATEPLHIRGGRADYYVDGVRVQAGSATRQGDESWRYAPPVDREGYAPLDEIGFRRVADAPLSTFSIDVDRASYANTRRMLTDGYLPPSAAVRIEEFVNYFEYGYAGPEGEHPFAVHTEVAESPWNAEHRLVRIALQGERLDTESLPPSNLVFLLDVSGSMNSPDKLPLLANAFRLLTNELRPQDRVAIVVYAGAAGLVLEPTPGDEKQTILAALNRLRAGGSTAGGAGIQLAYATARRTFNPNGNNRVILATDGDFNVGASSDAAMQELIEEERESGIFLSVLGFGTGNLQDSKMETLADHGNGNYSYIDSMREAHKVFVREFGGTLVAIAKDVKVQVEFNPAAVAGYRLIGYENRMLRDEEFNDDTRDAGELGAGHRVTALYEIVPHGATTALAGIDSLRYQTTTLSPEAGSGELLTVKLRYKPATGPGQFADESVLLSQAVADAEGSAEQASESFRWAAAVAEFALVLRQSEYAEGASYDEALALARSARGQDRDGDRAEFIQLVEIARSLDQRGEPVQALRD